MLKRLIKEVLFMVWLQMLTATPFLAATKKQAPAPLTHVSHSEILKDSQISYRAEGGFTGIRTYNVIITCVDGKISTLKSIHDPRIRSEKGIVRRTGSMTTEQYLALWDSLRRQAVLDMKNAPEPNGDILDEFTVVFEAKVGRHKNQFQAYGCSRPEASRHYSVKNLLDRAVDMASLWGSHKDLALR